MASTSTPAPTDPVFTVGDLSTVWLVANVRESDAPKMKVGAAVEVAVLAYPGRIFNAKLAYVAPALDPNTRRLPVRAEIHNPDLELMPEMFASFRIVSGDSRLMPCGAAGGHGLRRRAGPRLGRAPRAEDPW